MKARRDPVSPWCSLVRVRSSSNSSSVRFFRMVGTGKGAYLQISDENDHGIGHASGEATLRAIADMIHDALDGKEPQP
jgi:hypothetical protein